MMLDWDRISNLRNEVGPDDFGEVVDLFLEEADSVTLTLTAQAGDRNLEEALHFLKGSALTLGFCDLSDLCQISETLASKGRAHEIDLGPILVSYETSKSRFLAELPSAFDP
ncbi:Hpt domain-containing protein [Sulfitobacter sp. M368]|jgi:HPt (histidine-containing phosphotransfer) domain-containing protein|nr:Hpt domain-containing protein [Sulfitobacter sp. M368]